MPRLAVVTLTWNAKADTLACLDSLRGQLAPDDLVIVCDNGSIDGTENAVRAAHPAVVYVQNGANLGYAGGNNPGIERALASGAPWVLCINNDTVFPDGCVAALVAHAEANPRVSVFQPLLVRAHAPDTVDSAGQVVFRCPGAVDALLGRTVADAPRTPSPIFGACGAAFLVKAEALRAAGPLDEGLFVVFEDVDLMFRLRTHGAEIELVPAVRVHHKRGISLGAPNPAAVRRRRFWLLRNSIALGLRYWPKRWLLASSPVLLLRAVSALLLARRVGDRCLPLWRASLAARPAHRAAMRRLRLDAWFSARP